MQNPPDKFDTAWFVFVITVLGAMVGLVIGVLLGKPVAGCVYGALAALFFALTGLFSGGEE